MFDDPFTPKRGRKNSNHFGGGLDFGLGSKSNSKPKRESVAKSQPNHLCASPCYYNEALDILGQNI